MVGLDPGWGGLKRPPRMQSVTTGPGCIRLLGCIIGKGAGGNPLPMPVRLFVEGVDRGDEPRLFRDWPNKEVAALCDDTDPRSGAKTGCSDRDGDGARLRLSPGADRENLALVGLEWVTLHRTSMLKNG